MADDAVRFHDYQLIATLLGGMDLARLPAENRAHGRHLRALASIARGDLAAARRDLRAAMDDPGECPIAGLLDWVEVVEARSKGRGSLGGASTWMETDRSDAVRRSPRRAAAGRNRDVATSSGPGVIGRA